MNTWRERWGAFLAIVSDPPSIMLLVCTIFLWVMLVLQSDRPSPTQLDKTVTVTLTLLVSLSSGILGGVLGKKWDDYLGERVIVARGKSAIRSLKLLLGSTVALQNRAQLFIRHITLDADANDDDSQEELSAALVTTHLEEITGRCILLAEGVLSSIESWTDIIPEADVKTQIGVISELNRQLEALNGEIAGLGNELSETKGKSESEITKLTDEKKHKEEELSLLQQKLAQQSYNLLPTGGSASLLTTGSSPSLAADFSRYLRFSPSASPSPSIPSADVSNVIKVTGLPLNWQAAKKKCSNCGNHYEDAPGIIWIDALCADCRSNGITISK